LKIYQIYVPELATYAKFKVFEPEEIEAFIANYKRTHKEPEIITFRKKVVDTFIFNLKSDIIDALRAMSREAATACTDALFKRMHYAQSPVWTSICGSVLHTPENTTRTMILTIL